MGCSWLLSLWFATPLLAQMSTYAVFATLKLALITHNELSGLVRTPGSNPGGGMMSKSRRCTAGVL